MGENVFQTGLEERNSKAMFSEYKEEWLEHGTQMRLWEGRDELESK